MDLGRRGDLRLKTVRKFYQSIRNASEGSLHCAKDGRNFRIELVIGVYAVIISLISGVTGVDLAIIIILCAMTLICEMFNTSLELLCDMSTESFDVLAKRAKDIAAGGVLLSSIASVVAGSIVFFRPGRLQTLFSALIEKPFLIVLIVILLIPSLLFIFLFGSKR